MDQQTQELVNLCPHLSGMTLEEQKLSLTQNRSVLQQHFKAVNLAEKVPLTCPYANILNNGSETWKLEDCRCGICNHYLFKAKRVDPCHHVFCSSCLDRKKVNETKICTQCGESILDIENDSFRQFITDSYVESQFELAYNELQVPTDIEDQYIFRIQQHALYFLNKAVANTFNIERSITYLDNALNILSPAKEKNSVIIGNVMGVLLGKKAELLASVGCTNDAVDLYQQSIRVLESITQNEESKNSVRVSLTKLADLFLYRLNKMEQAKELYEKAVVLANGLDEIPIRIKLGETNIKMGEKESGKKELQIARDLLERTPESELTKRYMSALERIEGL